MSAIRRYEQSRTPSIRIGEPTWEAFLAAASLPDAYGETISRVAKQVARQCAARAGYTVVSADDIEQAVYEQFLKSGMTAETLDAMDEPQAYIRTTACYYGASNQVRAARRSTPVAFMPSEVPDLGAALLRDTCEAADGDPEGEVVAAAAVLEALRGVQAILNRLRSPMQREVASLCYLNGLTSYEIAEQTGQSAAAVRKALQRARDYIGPEAEASLRAWRRFAHPEAKRPERIRSAMPGTEMVG